MKQCRGGKGAFLSTFAAVAMAIGFLAGCSSQEDRATENLSAAQIGERIQQAVSLDDMKQGGSDKLQKLYHIDVGEVEDFILYTASSNVKADELAVIKVKNAKQSESVKEKIKILEKIVQRIDAQTAKFKDYRPDEYYLIKKHVLKSNGPFIFFAVSKEADQLDLAFDEAFK
ncbi:DUF4358 domain-containing protein [Brevibacillus humidisoli]|uniref:DUF4358 domain-containing protein n=1 Tax=Brevibacillus humidisoli TaxID=2895522 RepID=UPI001E2E6021|nr:DUF4358 domain-containing protein [Brevibacillus humidisoli]UFJ42637.1 DUF4358 domain-containing protein [Brevibacillus humidisoli]